MAKNPIFSTTLSLNILCFLLGILNFILFLMLGGILNIISAIVCFASALFGFYVSDKEIFDKIFNKIIKTLFTKRR